MKPFFKNPDAKDDPKPAPKSKATPKPQPGTDTPAANENDDSKPAASPAIKPIVPDDKDLDFTVKDNVEICLIKYRNQLSASRRNYDLDKNIYVLNLMLEAQKKAEATDEDDAKK